MTDYTAGEAKLSIIPDATGFAARLKADLEKIQDKYKIPFDADTKQADEKLEKTKLEAAKPVKTQLEIDLKASEDRLRALRIREQANKLGIKVEVDTAQADLQLRLLRTEAEARSIKARVDVDGLQAARKEVESFAKAIADIGPGPLGNVFQFSGGLALLGELPAATTGVVQLAGALQQLAGAGLAIPGIIGGVAASVGTLVLGLSGISDAYSAVSKAALSSGRDQAETARRTQSAQNQQRNATVDLAQANKDLGRAYGEAKRQLEDLNISLRGGQISEQQAVNDALRERRDLQHDMATGQIKDNLDLQDRLLGIEAADQQVVESHQRNAELQDKVNDANQRGISGSDQVVAANERIVRSQQAVGDANAAVAQASSQTSASAQAADQALANISPKARDLVQTFVDLKPKIQESLQFPVQDTIVDGLAQQIRNLVDADLPTLQSGLGGIAQAWNSNLKALIASLGSDNTRGLLDRILGNTADAQAKVSQFIDPLVRGIGTLTAAGSDALPRIVDDLGSLADRFASFIEGADKDGRLNKWINDGITGFEHLGNILLNLGSSFTAITRAAGGGAGLLGTFDSLSEKLAAFLNSTEGQNKLKTWFEEGRREIQDHIIPLLQALPGFFKGVVDVGTEIANTVVPPLKDIAGFLSDHPRLIRDVVVAFGAWKGIAGVASLLSDLGKIDGLLGVGGKGKGGKGGKGILGKLGLITIAGVALDTALDDSDGTGGDTSPAPPPVPSGGVPVGQPVPFGSVPTLPPSAASGVVTGAVGGGLTAGTPGALGGAFLGAPGAKTPSKEESDFNSIVAAIPQMDDASLKQLADLFRVTPDQLRSMSRDELHKRYMDALASGHAGGGILPGYSPGVDNMLVPMSGGEGVIIPTVTRKLGPEGIAAINRGALTGFAGGGIVDQFGNPVTPGTPPGGPAPIAGNPTNTGIVSSVIGGVASGVQGPIGNALSLGSSLFGAVQGATGSNGVSVGAPNFMDRLAKVPGIAGLIGSAGSSNPGAALSDWGQQTGQWLGNFAAKTAGSFGTALWQGALGLVGLDNSILSPNNPWFQAGSKGVGAAFGTDGPLGALFGGGFGGSGDSPQLGSQTIQLGDGSTIEVPTFGTSGTTTSTVSSTSPAAYTAPPTSGSGAERWRPAVRAALAKYGPQFGITNTQAWEDAIVRQINTESGGNPTAINNYDSNAKAGHPSQGVLQFIPSTFAANNITGGAFLDPLAQIAAVIPYVVHRYGMNASGGPNAIGQGHGYARGGIVGMVPMSGGEGIIDPAITAKLGPAGIAAINRGALTGFAEGGIVPPPYALINPPKPPPNLQPARAIQAQPITPRASAQVPSSANFKQLPAGAVPSPGVPTPSPAAPAQPTAPPPTVAPKDQAPRYTPTTGQLPVTTISGNPADHLDHNLPALDKGIDSGAQAIGQAASTAIAIAAGIAAGAGSSGFSPGASAIGAIGAIGPYVAGLIQEGGKVVKDVANIGSSFLVGTVQPGTTPSQFGETLTAPQNIPQTAQDNRRNYVFNGIDGSRVVDDIRLKDAQDMQAPLAQW